MDTPTSTYRLQLTPEFGFDKARAVLPYLRGIGADWIYLSPVLQAASGSTHGYDVVDPTRVSDALGGPERFRALTDAAHEAGMGVLVDIVPNHLGVQVPRENAWWWDVLRHGEASEHARVFDIDWAAGDGRVLLPVIGDDDMPTVPGAPIGNLVVDPAAGVLRYHDNEFPLAPGSAEGEPPSDAPDAAAEQLLTGDAAMRVHAMQHYRLIHWRQGDFTLNYRRFFTVTGLAGVRVEDPDVFEATHAEILRWVREGLVDGLRVDHPDGLRDPAGYLERLAERTGGVYVVVEKILEPGERLEASWATTGTTGYDALGEIDRILTDPESEGALDELTSARTGSDPRDWHALVHEMKRDMTDGPLHAEVNRITRELTSAGVDHPDIVDAVSELLAWFPVYRTYLPDGGEHLDEAVRGARAARPDLDEAIDAVLPALRDPEHPAAQRLQMTSGMVMAKAVEDRAFYRYSRLTSLNEVGGDPSVFSISLEQFHELQRERQATCPLTMTTLSTHDTKRGEDVRAAITVLSEVPELWEDTLVQLMEAAPISHPGFANLLWQAVVGAWPATRQRLKDYALKAAREAGDRTSWTMPDDGFEGELRAAVDAVFDDAVVASLVQNFAEQIREARNSNALTAKLIQLTMPGVPDVYQGSELWRNTLVDPDNRRPVDYGARASALQGILSGVLPPIDHTGAVKLLVTAAALLLRRDRPQLFDSYEPVVATGPAAQHAVAFSRGGAITVATRLPLTLDDGGGWGDTMLHLPEGEWIDQLTARPYRGGSPVSIAALLGTYPVALLARAE
ncbi:malto-oligosyltrehalose synthase [Pseudoclavibacter endophyticus]|uniref:Malto-oligosyltrehalose synthase n=1 Tax=Pseudoclavibacter endophyticus TaxID=1778590 RepID=A0A6H9WN66_9MICO|nr:malto-oligosyltrehalose synthase [Pseudoclavibacter endophyticus]KAB1646685.1 malto-oligosyltrehalose synthase [Pseudoclavibacter endophyticus]GGA76476.1 malto-oligosyltrehalose synthase [Pseudoclavibacter endophyticus]